ncbi:hypothetical protein OGP53_003806 [Pseudomonas aeruginosa]|nr:hypothetical protein [Pseudomonas aeruginosa]MDF5907617.1 hypothetical protein [Pseudomonas aeruginosa]
MLTQSVLLSALNWQRNSVSPASGASAIGCSAARAGVAAQKTLAARKEGEKG